MAHKDHGLQNCETIGCDAPLTFELLGGRMLGPNFPGGTLSINLPEKHDPKRTPTKDQQVLAAVTGGTDVSRQRGQRTETVWASYPADLGSTIR
jgi:hypothetical protein